MTRNWHHEYGLGDEEWNAPTEAELTGMVMAAGTDIGALWEAIEPQGTDMVAGALFAPANVSWYPWQARYTTDEAIGLLSTYSLYLRMTNERREQLLAKM